MVDHETFFSLIRDPAHWELELFIQVVFDGLIGLVLWPFFRQRVLHHQSDDARIAELERKVVDLEKVHRTDPFIKTENKST